jgi:hypothetical protein
LLGEVTDDRKMRSFHLSFHQLRFFLDWGSTATHAVLFSLAHLQKKRLIGRRDLAPHEDSKPIEYTSSNEGHPKNNLQGDGDGDGDARLEKPAAVRRTKQTMAEAWSLISVCFLRPNNQLNQTRLIT